MRFGRVEYAIDRIQPGRQSVTQATTIELLEEGHECHLRITEGVLFIFELINAILYC
jgi:hypothetical protein